MPPAAQTAQPFLVQMQLLLVDGGVRFLVAIAILVVGWMLATYVKRWVMAGLEHLPIDLTLKPLLGSLFRYAVLILTFILVLGQFGVQTTGLIAVMGAAGLAIGLALQGTLSNVAAGVMLLVLRPFRVGQFVEINNRQGTVREIGLFTTVLVTRDAVYVSIPNSSVFGTTIINYTREPRRRIDFTVPVDVINDVETVEKILVEALAANTHVLKHPEPSVGVSSLQEYTMVMFVRGHVVSSDYWEAMASIQKDVKSAMDKAGVLPAVTRQALAIRNEPQSGHNRPPTDDLTA
ncbi:MAG: mechanosensitive ion channel domain-containing protein [Rhizomicrobium sp.]